MAERQEKSRWARLLQQATDPIFLLDRNRRVLYVNPAFARLTSLGTEHLRGRTCRHQFAASTSPEESLLATLAPPLEVLAGKAAGVRRPAPDQPTQVWDMSFFPVAGPEGLLAVVGKIVATAPRPVTPATPLPVRLLALRERGRDWHRLDHLRSDVPAMRRVFDQVRLALRTGGPVWLSGEVGTGKKWLARTLHLESNACERGFLALDCRRLPPAWIMGRFAGATGTVYLQDPHFLPREAQAQLVDRYRDRHEFPAKEVTPRIVIGVTAPTPSDDSGPRWLEEFYCAFSTLSITLPPLRERRADLRGLAERLLPRAASGAGKNVTGLSLEAWELIETAAWPGNLGELFVVLRQACLRAADPVLHAGDLPYYLRSASPSAERTLPLDELLEQVERRLVLLALERTQDNKSGKLVVNKSRAAICRSTRRSSCHSRLPGCSSGGGGLATSRRRGSSSRLITRT